MVSEARKAGVEFFKKTLGKYSRSAHESYERSGYKVWESKGKKKWRRSYDFPTDNSAIHFNDNEKRALPKAMLLHPSVEYFRSDPENGIDAYKYLK